MMEFVVDWNSVCLVCLQEGEMRSIYDKDDKDIPFSDKIMKCAPIEITNGMNMPEQICLICIEDLAAAYRFRTNCESSNVILKSFIDGTIVSDVELPSYNGQVYRYKPPIGLDVKRVKPIKNIKVEAEDPQYDEEDDNISYTDELYVSAGENELNPDAEDENGVETVIAYEEEERPIKLEKDNEIEGYSDSEDYGMKIEKSDGEIIQVFEESDIIEETVGVVSKIRPRQENKKKASDKGPGKRGRPKSAVSSEIKSEVNSANVQAFVEGLTTSVAFKRKTRVDGKPMKICEICGNSYKYQHALESHMRRHRNEKPYSCEFCDRAFVANVELRRHMRVHTGQKPYGCNYCSRKFSDFGSRIKHERTHTGERPYQCTTCGKSFAYAHVLSVHLLTHTGEKKFKCEVCGKGFTKKLYLLSHMNHHQPPINRDATTPVIVNEYIVPTDLDLFKTEEVS